MIWSVFDLVSRHARIALLAALLAGVIIAPSVTASTVVYIYPGTSIQSAVEANATGTVFVIKAGTHHQQSVYPKDGMTFIGENGAVLDGDLIAERAFGDQYGGFPVNNVTIRNLRITRYAPQAYGSVIDGHAGSGWLVEANEIDNNSRGTGNATVRTYGIGVGSNWTVRHNRVHANGWAGITGYSCHDTIIEGNDVYSNPITVVTDPAFDGDAANIKLYQCDGMTVISNFIHDGLEEGIWLDTGGVTTAHPKNIVENNWISDQGDKGIWYENTLSGDIHANHVKNAGYRQTDPAGWMTGGGIQVTNSPNVTVKDNVIVNSHNGFVGQKASGYTQDLLNLLVQNNTITMLTGATGIVAETGDPFTSGNNRFVGNHYILYGNSSTPFRWQGNDFSIAAWQTAGNDTTAGGATFVY
jgi:hypothetical protein